MSAVVSPVLDSPRPTTSAQLDQLSINCIRTLSIDAVQQAKSGHPGAPMALAPLVFTLWNRVMRFDPQDAIWPNRDRFVLSNGHTSMLLWSVLHLTGTRAVNATYERLGQPAVSAVEQASTFGWERYVSKSGRVIGIVSSIAALIVQRPSPESETLPAKLLSVGSFANAAVVRSSNHEAMTLPRRQTSAMSPRSRCYR